VCPVRAFRPRPRLGDGEALEDVIHLRLTSEEGLSAPSQLMLIGPSLGRPGWVDLYCDMTGCEARSTTRPPPTPTGRSDDHRHRVLSVIYALDSIVNIEPPTPNLPGPNGARSSVPAAAAPTR
jgi:hypothetical protein